jgi:hypothetical protein
LTARARSVLDCLRPTQKSMSKCLFVFLLALATRGLLADDFKTIDGKEYKNVTVSRVEPDGIVLITSSGVSKVYFTELPKEVQERFNYDPAKAKDYAAREAANEEEFRKQRDESQRKLTEEKNKYWSELERSAPSSQGESRGHKRWISGKVVEKSNDALLIECSGEGHDGYEGATGRIVLRNHPNFAMLAKGDHVEVFGVAITAAQWGGDSNPYLHAYRVPSPWRP